MYLDCNVSLPQHTLSHLEAMLVEGVHLGHIGFDAGYLDGVVGTDDGNAPFAFETLDPLELGIVALGTGDESLAQLGIARIEERGDA